MHSSFVLPASADSAVMWVNTETARNGLVPWFAFRSPPSHRSLRRFSPQLARTEVSDRLVSKPTSLAPSSILCRRCTDQMRWCYKTHEAEDESSWPTTWWPGARNGSTTAGRGREENPLLAALCLHVGCIQRRYSRNSQRLQSPQGAGVDRHGTTFIMNSPVFKKRNPILTCFILGLYFSS